MPTTALADAAAAVTLGSALSAADSDKFSRYQTRMRRFAEAMSTVFSSMPPRLGTNDWGDRLSLLKLGWAVRKLGRRDMRELLRIVGMNVHDLLEERFRFGTAQGQRWLSMRCSARTSGRARPAPC